MTTDEEFMRKALELASKGNTSPNPMVGCVIVRDGAIVAEGYHKKAGKPHAEVEALRKIKDAGGCAIYVTLEPCCHYGRTPPCTKAIIKADIKKVVLAMRDPNPIVCGKGIQELKNAGIEVIEGVLEDEARRLNESYIKYITTKKPFVILKAAMSLDGKIASKTGDSKWISSRESRREVHELRARVGAVLVGVNTIIVDNPRLTCRIGKGGGRNPLKIIVDSRLRAPLNARIFDECKVLIATTRKHDSRKRKLLEERGVKFLIVGGDKNGRVDLKKLMGKLSELEITSVLIEGGGEVNASALEAGIVDKILFYVAPKIIGGVGGKTPVAGEGVELVKNAVKIKDMTINKIGEDILLEGHIRKKK